MISGEAYSVLESMVIFEGYRKRFRIFLMDGSKELDVVEFFDTEGEIHIFVEPKPTKEI